MNIEELTNHLHGTIDGGKVLKEKMVFEAKQQADLPPCLWYVSYEGSVQSVMLAAACDNPLHVHTPEEILAGALGRMREQYGRPILLIVAAEGFVDMADMEPHEVERGDMARDFATNPASTVTEAIIVSGAQDDLVGGTEFVQVVQPYGYDDGLQLVWHDRVVYADDDDGEYEGGVATILRRAITITDEEFEAFLKSDPEPRDHDDDSGVSVRVSPQWQDCQDEEIRDELIAIEGQGLDITAGFRQLLQEEGYPEFAAGIERVDIVWDGNKSFGIGIKMTPAAVSLAPEPLEMDVLHRKLVKGLADGSLAGDWRKLPVSKGVFHALWGYEFGREIDETLGKEGDDEHGSG